MQHIHFDNLFCRTSSLSPLRGKPGGGFHYYKRVTRKGSCLLINKSECRKLILYLLSKNEGILKKKKNHSERKPETKKSANGCEMKNNSFFQ